MKRSTKLYTQKIKVNHKTIILYEILLKLFEERFADITIDEKIRDLIKYVETTYFPAPVCDCEYDIEKEEYILVTKYRKILD